MIIIASILTTHCSPRVKTGKSAKCVIWMFQKKCKKNMFVSSLNAKTFMTPLIFTLTNATFNQATDNQRNKRDRKMGRFLFFDVESMVEAGETVNEAICVVAQFGDTRLKLFEGIGCMTEFCEWLFEHYEQNAEPLTMIAHNLGGFDIFFILKWIIDNREPEILFDGARVITMNT